MSKIIGGCLCGKVRYSAAADPAFVAVCHCRNCQKQGGTAFSVVVALPRSALSIEGTTRTYQDTGDSGQPILRLFCPECGSPITSNAAAAPQLTFLKAGTLDDTSWLNPQTHIFCDSAQPWVAFPPASQKFARMPG